MITMINQRNGHQTKFKNYKKLYSQINSYKWTKRANRPHNLIEDWFFGSHSYRRAMAFYEFIINLNRESQKNPGRKLQRFDVLEISDDRLMKPVIISLTPDVNVESLLEDWCKRYCKFHGYKLAEVPDDDSIVHVNRP